MNNTLKKQINIRRKLIKLKKLKKNYNDKQINRILLLEYL